MKKIWEGEKETKAAFCVFVTPIEAATEGVLLKKAFLKIYLNSQENICARDSF